jgi:hypothetical protein
LPRPDLKSPAPHAVPAAAAYTPDALPRPLCGPVQSAKDIICQLCNFIDHASRLRISRAAGQFKLLAGRLLGIVGCFLAEN